QRGSSTGRTGRASGEAIKKGGVFRFVRMVRRGGGVPVLCAAACGVRALVYLCLATRLYEATAQLLVFQEGGRPFQVAGADLGRPQEVGGDYIPNHLAILHSPTVVQRAIESVGLENLPTLRAVSGTGRNPVSKVIDAYLKISRPERQAKVIRIDYLARSPEEAVRMLEAIMASYRKFLEENSPGGSAVVAVIDRARRELQAD